ncbi:hypothetical protein LMG26857_00320 [Achromobacter anxifer]|uniref:YcxB family protein n=1 Tax=Achromobacter anxifer TaxID=1287737 RepID=UPI00155CDF7A|nr:YcxB family protein [Achromobacter anxifer]CAB5511036.1 hypothetical protein LMG26857_00320 [Achromobacter anxifer]
MFEHDAARNTGQASRGGIPDGNAAGEPADVFTIVAPIDLEVRIAAALYAFADMFAAARRRLLYLLGLVALLMLLAVGVSTWQKSVREGADGFVPAFFHELFGPGGIAILFVAIPTLIYYALQPALVRSRLKRWCRDEHLDRPITVTYRFGPDGLSVTQPGRNTVLACPRLDGVAEAHGHLIIRLRNIEDAYALPLSALSAAQVADIKAWAASCHAGAGGAVGLPREQDTAASSPPLFTSRFAYTEEDRVVALRWQMERPGMQRRRRRGYLLTFLITALLVPLFFIMLWLLDPARVPFRYAFPLFVEMFASTFWQYALGLWAFAAAVIVLQPWARRRQAQTLARRLHQRMQAEEYELRLHEDRLDVWQSDWCNSFDAASFAGVQHHGEHLILLRRESEPLILPLRALDGGQLALLERVVGRRAGGAGGQTEQNA